MLTAVESYEAGLREGRSRLLDRTGRSRPWPVSTWTGPVGVADAALLDRCGGPTLDIGCGPGRLSAELTRRGVPALGIDISALAVAMARAAGASALLRDVFGQVPGAGRWQAVLLADGNIGIGGHPVRLLQRCRELVAPGGFVHLDLAEPGTGVVVEAVRLQVGPRVSAPFRWGWVGVDALLPIAALADLSVYDLWCCDGRWQASLQRVPVSSASAGPA